MQCTTPPPRWLTRQTQDTDTREQRWYASPSRNRTRSNWERQIRLLPRI